MQSIDTKREIPSVPKYVLQVERQKVRHIISAKPPNPKDAFTFKVQRLPSTARLALPSVPKYVLQVERLKVRHIISSTSRRDPVSRAKQRIAKLFPSDSSIVDDIARSNNKAVRVPDWCRYWNARMKKRGPNRDACVPDSPYSRISDYVVDRVRQLSAMDDMAINAAASSLGDIYESFVWSYSGPRLVDHFEGFALMCKGRRLQRAQGKSEKLRQLSSTQLLLVWAWHENEAANRLFRRAGIAAPVDQTLFLECAVQAAVGAAKSLAVAEYFGIRRDGQGK
jgi:hypothetical protein